MLRVQSAWCAPLLAVVGLAWGGCQGGPSAEIVQARADLEAALATRSVEAVSKAARAASVFEGQDPALDARIGDALANVLMRTTDGLELLRRRPLPEDPVWVDALMSGGLRVGSVELLDILAREAHVPRSTSPTTTVAWLGVRARKDPNLRYSDLLEAEANCRLFDGQPTRGRRTVDQPVAPGFFDALQRLGADRVVLGRAETVTDPAPSSGEGLQPCIRGRIYADAVWPSPLPKHITVAISADDHALYVSVRPENGEPWAFASLDNEIAGDVVAHARAVSEGTAVPDAQYLPERLSSLAAPIAPPLVEE